jgi:hypothetical protein
VPAARRKTPLNGPAGHAISFIAQAHFFLDDLLSGLFGKPLFRQ